MPIYLALVPGVELAPVSLTPPEVFVLPPWEDWFIWGLCVLVGFFGARAIGVPFGEILGPMILCATIYIFVIVTVTLAPFVTIATQIVIGTSIGTQLAQLRRRHVLRTVITSMGTTIVTLAGALIIAELMAPLLGMDPLSLLLALVPGGLVEMGLISVALDADTAFISTMHKRRIMLIAVNAPLLFGLVGRRLPWTYRHSPKIADKPDSRSG